MKTPLPNAEDAQLRALLQEALPAPALPPRFQDAVWQRLDQANRRPERASSPAWLETLVRWWSRPAYATAGLVVVMLAGIWLGVRAGEVRGHREDQARYVAAVSPLHRVAL